MGAAAMNVAAVELFDEMNTVNEKVNATLRIHACLLPSTASLEDLRLTVTEY